MTCRHIDSRDHTTLVVTLAAHADPLPAGHPDQCRGCAPCPRRHCTVCATHLGTDELQTCTDCLGQARRDLAQILDLVALLPAHALRGATHSHLVAADPIPGSDALVLLGRGSEGLAEDGSTQVDLDPPAWTLAWWEENFRDRLGLDSRIPAWRRRADRTLIDAHTFLVQHLGWAASNHPGFHVLAADLKRSRAQLEELLHAGDQPAEGVACFTCGTTLERQYRDPKRCSCGPRPRCSHAAHHRRDLCCLGCATELRWELRHATCDQGGLAETDPHVGWACPRCKRTYSPGEYQLAVKARHDDVAEYRRLDDCVRLTGAKRGSIQGWASGDEPKVRKRRDTSGRVTYNLADIRTRLAAQTKKLG